MARAKVAHADPPFGDLGQRDPEPAGEHEDRLLHERDLRDRAGEFLGQLRVRAGVEAQHLLPPVLAAVRADRPPGAARGRARRGTPRSASAARGAPPRARAASRRRGTSGPVPVAPPCTSPDGPRRSARGNRGAPACAVRRGRGRPPAGRPAARGSRPGGTPAAARSRAAVRCVARPARRAPGRRRPGTAAITSSGSPRREQRLRARRVQHRGVRLQERDHRGRHHLRRPVRHQAAKRGRTDRRQPWCTARRSGIRASSLRCASSSAATDSR